MKGSHKILLMSLLPLVIFCFIGCSSVEVAHLTGSMVGAVFDGAEAGINNTQPGTKYQQMFAAAAVQDVLQSEAREAGVGTVPAEWQGHEGHWDKDAQGHFCWYRGEDYIYWDGSQQCWKAKD